MPGDEWQKLANLRLLLAYMFTRPGKKLLFMGTELAVLDGMESRREPSTGIWSMTRARGAFVRFVVELSALYKREPAFWRDDSEWEGFRWIDVADKENSVLSYARRSGESRSIVVLPTSRRVPRERYRIGVPEVGRYECCCRPTTRDWGGTGHASFACGRR